MFSYFKKSDERLVKDTEEELDWDPRVSAKNISVTAKDGIVTLRGHVPHFIEKSLAEQSVHRVGGVRAVVDELKVTLIDNAGKTDEDIASAAIIALEWNYAVPETVKVSVEKGWITLRGEVDWNFERLAAKNTVANLRGVIGVTNNITLRSKPEPIDIRKSIQSAFKRSAENEGGHIKISVTDNEVTLSGKVHSLHEKENARIAAWNAPGVIRVRNNLIISL